MVLATKKPAKSKIFLAVTQHQIAEPSKPAVLHPQDDFSYSLEEPPEEIYEPTDEDEAFMDEVRGEQCEFEEAGFSQQGSNNGNGHDTNNLVYLADYRVSPRSVNGNGHAHTNGHREPTEEELEFLKQEEMQLRAEQIVEQAREIFPRLKYACFVSRSKGRYHYGKKLGQQIPRRHWKEVELVSRGVEPKNFIGNGYRHRVFWPASRFPWDEVADGMGMDEGKLMSLLPTLAHNAKQARRYLRAGSTPDYRKIGLVTY